MRVLRPFEPYFSGGLPRRLRDALAIGAILASALLGLSAIRVGLPDHGIHLHVGPDRITIADISPWGAAAQSSLRPGMVVLQINEFQVSEVGSDPEQPITPPNEWGSVVAQPLWAIGAIPLAAYDDAVATGSSPPLTTVQWYQPPQAAMEEAWPAFVGGLLLLIGIWWWLLGTHGAMLRELAAGASAAVSAPLLLVPYAMGWGYDAHLWSTLTLPIAFFPLADGLVAMLPDAQRRMRMLLLTVFLVALGGGLLLVQVGSSVPSALVAAGFASGVMLVPAVRLYQQTSESTLGVWQPVLITPLELAALVGTPILGLVVLAWRGPELLWLVTVWIVVLIVAQRFMIAPLTRTVRRTRLQRDLVVQATEAERARIATDLHDVALQELTMLAMRLDAKGDTESADVAREVAERVREICGDLRLPLLDDFGVGPALEWLVDRLERVIPGRIKLEQADGARLPPDVELAIFRVAQEALGNAVRHGRPPIRVRFQVVGTRASLSVDDEGPGIEADAVDVAQQAGHLGLLNMQQRAEQVGALLDIRAWPTGGTHVGLEWRAT
jgi:signal transduction histidine kinase